MSIVDTHSHIYEIEFKDDLDLVIEHAKENGVEKVILPNVDLESLEPLLQVCVKYPDYCVPALGLHPTSVKGDYKAVLESIYNSIKTQSNVCAIGEIGIDLYWDQTFVEQQKDAFIQQLRWSVDMDLPVIIHTRNAHREVMDCIQAVGADKLRGVFHSFCGNRDELEEILGLDSFMIGVNGIVTFKNSGLAQTFSGLDILSRILVETDAPYLAPVPYRGKRNEPAYVCKTLQKVAEIFNLTVNEAEYSIRQNTRSLFKI